MVMFSGYEPTFRGIDPLRKFRRFGIQTSRPASQAPTLDPEVEDSMVRSLGRGVLGGAARAANVLDLPGSMARDVLTFQNPFDQLLTPTSDENRASGRDVLTHWGFTRPNDPNRLELADVAGFGAEMLLDPMLPFKPLSLTAKGAAAVKGGQKIAKGLERSIREGDRALFHYGKRAIGTGQTAQQIAKGLDTVGHALRYGNIPGTSYSPGRHLARLFSSRTKDMATTSGQKAGSRLHDLEAENRRQVGAMLAKWATQMHRADDIDGLTRSEYKALQIAEGMDPEDLADIVDFRDIRQMRRIFEGVEQAPPELQPIVDEVLDLLKNIGPEFKRRGLRFKELQDAVNYIPRYLSALRKGKPGPGRQKVFSGFERSNIGREPYLKGLPRGTDTIIELGQDRMLNDMIQDGASVEQITGYIKAAYPYIPDVYKKLKDGEWVEVEGRHRKLAEFLTSDKLNRQIREAGIFGNHPLADIHARLVSARDRIAAYDVAMDTLADAVRQHSAQWATKGKAAQVDGTVKLRDILGQRGLQFKAGNNSHGWVREMARRLGIEGKISKATADFIKDLRVPEDIADDMTRLMRGFQSPESVNQLMSGIDRVTNVFKAMVTSPWPAFHVRNLMSGQFQNWIGGMWSRSSLEDAHTIARGGVVKRALEIPLVKKILTERGMEETAKNATDVLRELAMSHGLTERFAGEASTRLGKAANLAGTSFDDILNSLPGLKGGFSFRETAKKAIGKTDDTTLNPLTGEIRGGFTDAVESTWGPVKAGEDLGAYIENLNRLAPFIEQLRRGVNPREAARKVLAAQVDYSARNYTAFERQLQRLFPFYKFTRNMLPHTMRSLFEAPGGRLAQTMRLTNEMRDDKSAIIPDYVADTLSIPLGEQEDGTKRYLTGFGAMHEDPMTFLGETPGLELLSRMNPLVKGPLEYILDESFFQRGPEGGRDMDDLDPLLGRIASNVTGQEEPFKLPKIVEQAAANSPLARGLTTLRTLTDPRKYTGPFGPLPLFLNLGTGMRITDVSPGAQDAMLRELSLQEMKRGGARTFERVYYPKEMLEQLPPEERELAERYRTLQTVLASRAKRRKEERQKREKAEGR